MKITFTLFAAMCMYLSFCTPSVKENPKAKTGFYLRIDSISSRNNSDSPAYTNISFNGSDSVEFINASLRKVVASLLQLKEFMVETDDSVSLSKAVDIHFKNRTSDNSKNTDIIINQLQQKFDFKVERTELRIEEWNLLAENDDKLDKYESGFFQKESSITTADGKIKQTIMLENADLHGLASGIGNLYSKTIHNKTGLGNRYNLKIESTDFNHLQYILEKKYGLYLKKSIVSTPRIFVRFKA